MSHESLAESAIGLYSAHKQVAHKLRVADESITDSRRRIGYLRLGTAHVGVGLSAAAQSRQADIIADNLDGHDIPRRDKLQRQYDENLASAEKHLNEYFSEYVEMALEEMPGTSGTKE